MEQAPLAGHTGVSRDLSDPQAVAVIAGEPARGASAAGEANPDSRPMNA